MSLGSESNLQMIFRMIDPLKIVVCMVLKISEMTPRCLKRLPGDEYTGESQLPGGEYTGPGSLDSQVVNTPGSLDSPVMNTWGVDFLVFFEQA
jgi:hypothetical protein